jgi:hypothetical protein
VLGDGHTEKGEVLGEAYLETRLAEFEAGEERLEGEASGVGGDGGEEAGVAMGQRQDRRITLADDLQLGAAPLDDGSPEVR